MHNKPDTMGQMDDFSRWALAGLRDKLLRILTDYGIRTLPLWPTDDELVFKLRWELNQFKQAKEQLSAAKRRIARLRKWAGQVEARRATDELKLDALHWVWCSGGCNGGTHRFKEDGTPRHWDGERELLLTREICETAERNTVRMRQWLTNFEYHKKWFSDPEFQRQERIRWGHEKAVENEVHPAEEDASLDEPE